MNHSNADGLAGASAAVGAYFLWGISSVYWHLLASVAPDELLGYRVWVSCLMLVLMLAGRGALGATFRAACAWRSVLIYSGSAVSIATNWSVFMWASIHGHVVETGIG